MQETQTPKHQKSIKRSTRNAPNGHPNGEPNGDPSEHPNGDPNRDLTGTHLAPEGSGWEKLSQSWAGLWSWM